MKNDSCIVVLNGHGCYSKNETIIDTEDSVDGSTTNPAKIPGQTIPTDPTKSPDPTNGEAWHWRYIGEATAQVMPQISLGAYLDQVKIEQKKNK